MAARAHPPEKLHPFLISSQQPHRRMAQNRSQGDKAARAPGSSFSTAHDDLLKTAVFLISPLVPE